ncbi:MAG: SprT family zinc-dependent metalloprotease [Sphingomonadaceae bacterium]
MIDWLKQDPREEPSVLVGETALPIVVRRHPTARRITMRLAQDGREVRVTMPRWGRTAEALAFARSKADWLATQLDAIPRSEPLGNGSVLAFRGERLLLAHRPEARRKPVVADGTITVGGPGAGLESRLSRWLKAEALPLMADDLAHYCDLADKPAPRLALSNAKRRWGSCAPDGTIRINWRLVMAPDPVRRSVVAHEVAHLVHFDHSPAFHALLGDLFEGDIRAANLWLRREGRSLYLPFG